MLHAVRVKNGTPCPKIIDPDPRESIDYGTNVGHLCPKQIPPPPAIPYPVNMARNFKDLSEREILALAIALEEEDGRIYGDFVEGLRDTYPASAKLFEEMQAEESGHRAALFEIYRGKFGE